MLETLVVDRDVIVAVASKNILAGGLSRVKFHKPLICCKILAPLELYAFDRAPRSPADPCPRRTARGLSRTMEEFPRIKRLPPYVFNVTGELKLNARRHGEDVIDFSMG